MQPASLADAYTKNPLIHRDRQLANGSSAWARSFACDDMSILIVCRGPIRKEAIDVFREMGIERVGILLSERDSIVYPRALSPELRIMDSAHVHPVADYTGATKEERLRRVAEIIEICKRCGYEYVFAGYGFMAEDASFVASLEGAGLKFIGPGSATQLAAGAKDEAKRTAIANRVSVTPGINNATARTLLAKYPTREELTKLARKHGLDVPSLSDAKADPEELADQVLNASYLRHIDLYSIDELSHQLQADAGRLLQENPGRRFRLKAIGGGGGKGQRILSKAEQVPGFVREILNEVKATGVGDNKNILIELNVEQTRHNEIQIIGNGTWCIAMGGRDCSLQMHEQKLVEVSITQEGLEAAIAEAHAEGNTVKAAELTADLAVLRRMEDEAERFGKAVKLDSASTFECIVEGDRHYFMEVNTRIQVEHRVSELCYRLRFTNPENGDDFFDVDSLVECMALVARHRDALPCPERVRRENAAIEIRLNATDRSLNPHAGGVIVSWSDPIDGEIRDDQGISIKNPDTGMFMRYRLAGAYDSNIALLLATGSTRLESYERVCEILRCTTIRGIDLATNVDFHLGLVAWFLNRDVWAKPTTKFVVPYLTLVGELAQESKSIDFDYAFQRIAQNATAAATAIGGDAVGATKRLIELKETLLERPITMLIDQPHHLSAWFSKHRPDFEVRDGRVVWNRNPIQILADTYHLLYLDERVDEAAAHRIWDHDQDLLDTALAFYSRLYQHIGKPVAWPDLDDALRSGEPSFGFDEADWGKIVGAHAGHQLGLEILGFLPLIALNTGFYDLKLEQNLGITIPERLLDPTHQEAMRKVLVPPPATRADEIVAAMGGTYYGQEAPGLPSFVTVGAHFEKGDPLYIIEVMKMFNRVYASFSGTIEDVLVPESGVVVRKGQPLFKVRPDEQVVEEDPKIKEARIRARTDTYLERLL